MPDNSTANLLTPLYFTGKLPEPSPSAGQLTDHDFAGISNYFGTCAPPDDATRYSKSTHGLIMHD
jgi:hypothetical protein